MRRPSINLDGVKRAAGIASAGSLRQDCAQPVTGVSGRPVSLSNSGPALGAGPVNPIKWDGKPSEGFE